MNQMITLLKSDASRRTLLELIDSFRQIDRAGGGGMLQRLASEDTLHEPRCPTKRRIEFWQISISSANSSYNGEQKTRRPTNHHLVVQVLKVSYTAVRVVGQKILRSSVPPIHISGVRSER
jgi:hypothetical protein